MDGMAYEAMHSSIELMRDIILLFCGYSRTLRNIHYNTPYENCEWKNNDDVNNDELMKKWIFLKILHRTTMATILWNSSIYHFLLLPERFINFPLKKALAHKTKMKYLLKCDVSLLRFSSFLFWVILSRVDRIQPTHTHTYNDTELSQTLGPSRYLNNNDSFFLACWKMTTHIVRSRKSWPTPVFFVRLSAIFFLNFSTWCERTETGKWKIMPWGEKWKKGSGNL